MFDFRKIMIASMNRTGHHAISIWLMHQQLGVSEFELKTIAHWFFYLPTQDGISFLLNNPLVRDENQHPDKANVSQIMKDYCEANSTNLIIAGHEERSLKDVAWACGTSDIFGSGTELVVILRDFKNWVASYIKMAGRDGKPYDKLINDKKIDTYKDHCKFFFESSDIKYILFNRWFSSKEYRRELAEWLGLYFTDAAINQGSPFGGGSSFDKMEYLKTASLMKVNDRYKQMEDHPVYNRIIKENQEALEMSNEIFAGAD